MIKLIALLLITAQNAWSGLPPTTSKDSADSAGVTTFNFQFPNFTGTHTGITFALGVNSVAGGGTGIASGTSGGIPYFSSTTTIASSALLTQHAITIGGGAGATPYALGSLGTSTTVLHGAAAGDPTFGAVSLTADVSGILPVANATIATQALTTCTTARTVDWSTGNSFTLTLTSGNACTLTFSNPTSGQTITLWLTNGSAGGTATVVWPSAKWFPAGAPTMTTGTAALDVCTCTYNGTSYACNCLQNGG